MTQEPQVRNSNVELVRNSNEALTHEIEDWRTKAFVNYLTHMKPEDPNFPILMHALEKFINDEIHQ